MHAWDNIKIHGHRSISPSRSIAATSEPLKSPPWRCPPLLSPSPCVVVALSLQTPAAELRKRTHSKAKLKGAPECRRGGGGDRFRGGSGVGEAPLRAVPAVNPTARHSPAALL